jgi:phospholipid-binding lipoprotein MlaA
MFAASPPLLSAVLSVTSPLPSPDPAATIALAPMGWSLAPQDAGVQGTPPGDGPPDGEQGNEIIIEGEYGPPANDPVEQLNAESYRLTQVMDDVLVEPLAYAYRDGLPEPIRDGLGNVVRNLGEPSNALNYLLQGKVGKAFETLGRLAINSTLGIGGLVDIAAKPGIGLPYRRNGFANTAGYYGVGPGPYLFLPVTGPTSLRDIIGNTLDQALLPFAVGKPFNKPEYSVTYFVVNSLDLRLEYDAELAEIAASDDPYAMRRDTYLERRRRDIAALKGETLDIPEDADEAAPAQDMPPVTRLSLPERLQIAAGAVPEGR